MKVINNIILTIMLVAMACTCQSVHAQQSGTYKIVFLKDGSKFKGKIIGKKDDTTITLLLSNGQELDIDYVDIKSMKSVSPANRDHRKAARVKSDKLYFKNGSRLYGDVTTSSNDEIQVNLKNGQEISFNQNEISRIRYNVKERRDYQQKLNGYFVQLDIGLNFGEQNDFAGNEGHLAFDAILGYRFNPYLNVGIGSGIDKYGDFQTIPLFASIGGELGGTRVTPIYFANIGYARLTQSNTDTNIEFSDVKGGLMYHVGTGINIKWPAFSMNVKLGYKKTQGSYGFTLEDWDGRISQITSVERNFNRFAMTVGLQF